MRLPADLHRRLAQAATANDLSFNELCVRRLREPCHPQEMSAVRSVVVDRGRAAFGDRLLGVVALGSWARGEPAADSDIDVLLVIDPAIPLTRDLYRTWDQAPLAFGGRTIDAHFAHPSGRGEPPTAVWCEVAVDGLVWYDRDGAITRRVAEVRRAIADGQVVRGRAHGQTYWKVVA